MQLGRAGTLLRIVAAASLFTLALLLALSQLDFSTRATEPAPMQPPQLIRPLEHGGAIR